jgi:hypothetical protein
MTHDGPTRNELLANHDSIGRMNSAHGERQPREPVRGAA